MLNCARATPRHAADAGLCASRLGQAGSVFYGESTVARAGEGARPLPGRPAAQRVAVTRLAKARIGSDTLVSGLSKANTSET